MVSLLEEIILKKIRFIGTEYKKVSYDNNYFAILVNYPKYN